MVTEECQGEDKNEGAYIIYPSNERSVDFRIKGNISSSRLVLAEARLWALTGKPCTSTGHLKLGIRPSGLDQSLNLCILTDFICKVNIQGLTFVGQGDFTL